MYIVYLNTTTNNPPSMAPAVASVPVSLYRDGERVRIGFSQSAFNLPLLLAKSADAKRVADYVAKGIGPNSWLTVFPSFGLKHEPLDEQDALSIVDANTANATPAPSAKNPGDE